MYKHHAQSYVILNVSSFVPTIIRNLIFVIYACMHKGLYGIDTILFFYNIGATSLGGFKEKVQRKLNNKVSFIEIYLLVSSVVVIP